MEKSYQKYLSSVLGEADGIKSFTPAVRHSDSEQVDVQDLTKKFKARIKDAISSTPELQSIDSDIASNIVIDAIKKFGYDVQGKSIVPGRDDGIATLSQNFAHLSNNPLEKALYFFAMLGLSGQEADDEVKRKILNGLKLSLKAFPDESMENISKLDSEELEAGFAKVHKDPNILQRMNSTVANAYNKMIHASREATRDSNTTLWGDTVASKPQSKSKLITLLRQLDDEMFNIKASSFGNNYNSDVAERLIFDDYLNSRVPKGSVDKAVGDVIGKLKKDLFSGRDTFVNTVANMMKSDVNDKVIQIPDPKAPEVVQDAVGKEISALNDKLKNVTDKNEILSIYKDHMFNITAPKFRAPIVKYAKRYYKDFIAKMNSGTNVGRETTKANIGNSNRNAAIKKIIPERIMMEILKSVAQYSSEIVGTNITLSDWVQTVYGIESPVGQLWLKHCKANGGCQKIETPDLSDNQDIKHAKELGYDDGSNEIEDAISTMEVKPKMSEKPRRSEPINFDDSVKSGRIKLKPEPEAKKESFYDKMRNSING